MTRSPENYGRTATFNRNSCLSLSLSSPRKQRKPHFTLVPQVTRLTIPKHSFTQIAPVHSRPLPRNFLPKRVHAATRKTSSSSSWPDAARKALSPLLMKFHPVTRLFGKIFGTSGWPLLSRRPNCNCRAAGEIQLRGRLSPEYLRRRRASKAAVNAPICMCPVPRVGEEDCGRGSRGWGIDWMAARARWYLLCRVANLLVFQVGIGASREIEKFSVRPEIDLYYLGVGRRARGTLRWLVWWFFSKWGGRQGIMTAGHGRWCLVNGLIWILVRIS